MKILTEAEYEEIRAESLQLEELQQNTDGFDQIKKNRTRFSTDYYRGAELRPGLHLEIIDDKYHDALCVEVPHSVPYPLISKFYLSGNHRVLTPGIKEVKDEYVEKVNQNYLFCLPDLTEIEQTQAGLPSSLWN